MSRYFIFFLALNIQGFASIAYASNDLDKWNSEKGKVIRSQLKSNLTTTYKEKPNPLHTDSTYKASENGGKVLTKLETKAEIKGSRVGATIDALKEVDKRSVARKWAEKFAENHGKDIFKQGVRLTAGGILISAAMDEMLNGIGWIIDEGGKVTKPSIDAPWNDPSAQYYYESSGWTYTRSSSPTGSCSLVSAEFKKSNPNHPGVSYVVTNPGASGTVHVGYCRSSGQTTGGQSVRQVVNSNYVPNTPPVSSQDISQAEMIEKIRDYFENPQSPPSKDLLIQEAVKPSGKASIMWSDDPSSEQTIFQDNKETAERILNSDNPQGEGLTKTTPKIEDGTTVEADTTPKPNPENPTIPDPVTGQPIPNPNYNPNADTGSNTSFNFPAFCSWASVVCEWLDWTKEMPEDEEEKEEQNINDRGIFNRQLDTDFNLEGSCPSDFTFQMTNKYLAGSYTIPLNWLCMSFTFLGYAFVFLANCLGIWILYETVSRKELRF